MLAATAVARALGMARAIQVCALGAGAALFLIPAASLGLSFAVLALVLYELLFGLLAKLWAIAVTTGRQLITPAHLLGRVNAFLQAALTATLLVGAFAGGWLASRVGVVPVLIGAAAAPSARRGRTSGGEAVVTDEQEHADVRCGEDGARHGTHDRSRGCPLLTGSGRPIEPGGRAISCPP